MHGAQREELPWHLSVPPTSGDNDRQCHHALTPWEGGLLSSLQPKPPAPAQGGGEARGLLISIEDAQVLRGQEGSEGVGEPPLGRERVQK